MNHPPVPSNTQWYRYEAYCGSCWRTKDCCFALSEKDVLERKVLASVMRCEWLDEAKALDNKILEWCKTHAPEDCPECPLDFLLPNKYREHAEAWRMWGEAK